MKHRRAYGRRRSNARRGRMNAGKTDLRMVWAWRDANPDGTQAELREEFAEREIEITRSWVHTCWHKWPGLEQ